MIYELDFGYCLLQLWVCSWQEQSTLIAIFVSNVNMMWLTDCKELLRNSLIAMGEIGGNDYNYAFWQGKNTEETIELVPFVVDTIASAINVRNSLPTCENIDKFADFLSIELV